MTEEVGTATGAKPPRPSCDSDRRRLPANSKALIQLELSRLGRKAKGAKMAALAADFGGQANAGHLRSRARRAGNTGAHAKNRRRAHG